MISARGAKSVGFGRIINGVIYCLAIAEDGFWSSGLVCVDMVNEAFTRLDVPQNLFSSWEKVRFF